MDLADHKSATTCSGCGAQHTGALETRPGGGPPSPGDVTICFSCARPSVFSDDGSLRPPTEAERVEIDADPRVRELRAEILRTAPGVV